jgi:hypothetical protein
VDVIGSGPEREPWTPVRSALRAARARRAADSGAGDGTRPAGRARRVLVGVVAVVVAAGAMLALRAGTEPVESYGAAADIATTTVAPPNVYGRARLQPPPFDGLPGRTPIPNPTAALDRRTLGGPLPAVDDRTPGEAAASAAARLVLGRYCRRPWSLSVQMDVQPDWRRVRARASRNTPRPVFVDLRLSWDAATRTYAWTGVIAQLDTCS